MSRCTYRVSVYMWTIVCVFTHLEGLNKGPQQDADGVALPQQFDESSRSEQPQETQVYHLVLGKKNMDSIRYYNIPRLKEFKAILSDYCQWLTMNNVSKLILTIAVEAI